MIRALSRGLRRALLAVVHLYQRTLSWAIGGQCRFFPTCSHYAEDALLRKPLRRALGLILWRLARCQPFAKCGHDPVPYEEGEEAHYLVEMPSQRPTPDQP